MRPLKSFLALAVLAPFAVACGDPGEAPASAGDEQDFTQAKVTSAYSDTGSDGSCETLSVGEEHSDSQCKGVGDYALVFHDRIWEGFTAGLKRGDGDEIALSVVESLPLVPMAEEGTAFRSFGPKAEWRVPMNDHEAPFALGLRIIDEVPQADGKTTKKQHHLAVFKLTGTKACLFSLVEASVQSATANQIARDEMDRSRTEPCPALGEVKVITK